ncbi:uncharacterized protein [Drosophila bipectinata]|uniref:uncharacterized protein n=1 Tax=Drosophila bipectinata TaxID=42026 RepID=UPI001C897F28|nr:uncharacterized protein LOC108123229 [Drosophila bipectinata]
MLRAYMDEDICCFNAIKQMCEWFQTMMSTESSDICNNIKTIVTDAQQFVTDYKDHLLRRDERMVHGTVYMLFEMVKVFFEESGKNENRSTLKTSAAVAVNLLFQVLSVLKEITAVSTKLHVRVSTLIQQMSDMSAFVCENVTDTFIGISETMTFICLHYLKLYNESPIKEEQMPQWLKETILHICDTILNLLEPVFKKVALSIPIEKLEELVVLIHKYLLMLHEIISGVVTPIDEEVLQALIELLGETKPCHNLGKDIPLLLSTYITPYVINVIGIVYSYDDFQKYLISCLKDSIQSKVEYFYVCIGFITAVSKDAAEINESTCKTIERIFEYLFKDASNFVNCEKYDLIIESYATLLFLGESYFLFCYFFMGLFEEDIILAQACADVLMLCFRLKEVNQSWNQSEIEKALSFWNKCNNTYSMFSQQPSQWHVQRFLKYFHRIGKKELPDFNMENFRYISAVPPSQMGNKLLQCLENCSSDPPTQPEVYYEMAGILDLLAQQNNVDCSKWFLRSFEMAKELLSNGKSMVFFESYFKLLAKENKATQLVILRGLPPLIGDACWNQQKFIFTCKASDDPQLKAFSARLSIGNNIQSILDAMFRQNTSVDTSVDLWSSGQDLSIESIARQKHECSVSSLKRKRSDDSAKEILKVMYEKSTQFRQSNLSSLEAADWDRVKDIVVCLTSICNEKNN